MNRRFYLWVRFFSVLVFFFVILGLMAFAPLPAAVRESCLPMRWFFLHLPFNPMLVK